MNQENEIEAALSAANLQDLVPPGAGEGNQTRLPAGVGANDVNLDTLLKVPVSLSIEVGRTRMPMHELLNTREGTVIELDRLLDEPLDILVNGTLIAHGVVVLANERFGLQITDIVSPQDRVRSI